MKILWLCNIMLPVIAEQLGMEASNKEGWLSGLADVILARGKENKISLAVAFPAPQGLIPEGALFFEKTITVKNSTLQCYGYYEDVVNPHKYDESLEKKLQGITEHFQPDVVHCYGTEYPHTLALCKVFPKKERILISIQGLCSVCANAYFADLPEAVVRSVTFRDWLKHDSLQQQQQKFALRGEMEREAVQLAGNITGRTAWDRHYTKEWNPKANYYAMNETLRSNFYEGQWEEDKCRPYSILLSQGDYPLKGLHYMLLALPQIKKKYPQVKVYVAGNSIVNYRTLKDKIKISAYGKYLLKLIKQNQLDENVEFLGRLNAEEMKAAYLKSHLFVCCSSLENSPNSLGEAMLLGVPCVSARVGGIASIFDGDKDGIFYEGFKTGKNSFDNICDLEKCENELEENAKRLASSVVQMWEDKEQMLSYSRNARMHAEKTHNQEQNYKRMTEIYSKIVAGEVE